MLCRVHFILIGSRMTASLSLKFWEATEENEHCSYNMKQYFFLKKKIMLPVFRKRDGCTLLMKNLTKELQGSSTGQCYYHDYPVTKGSPDPLVGGQTWWKIPVKAKQTIINLEQNQPELKWTEPKKCYLLGETKRQKLSRSVLICYEVSLAQFLQPKFYQSFRRRQLITLWFLCFCIQLSFLLNT